MTQQLQLYEHQKQMLSRIRAFDEYALFCEMRTGKTLPVLCRILELARNKRINKALIIAPKAARGAWFRDTELFDDDSREILVQTCVIVSYDMVWRREEYTNAHWDVIVLDESHKIKNRTTRRAKAILDMALNSTYRWILTGTPISNGAVEDLWPQFAFLFPEKAPKARTVSCELFGTYYDFINKYAYLNQYHKPYKYHNLSDLQEIVDEHSYRVTMADVSEIAPKNDLIYDIELEEPKWYKEMHKASTIEEEEILAENPLVRMLRLRQICSGFVQTKDKTYELKCEKPAALADFLEGNDKPLVVFCEFKHSIRSVAETLTAKKISYGVLDGETKDKEHIWRAFQAGEFQVIVCQYQTANAGIDLWRADTIIFYEPTLSSNILEQAKARITTVSKTGGDYIHFLTKNTIEQAIYKALESYKDFSRDFFEEYLTEYEKGVNYR